MQWYLDVWMKLKVRWRTVPSNADYRQLMFRRSYVTKHNIVLLGGIIEMKQAKIDEINWDQQAKLGWDYWWLVGANRKMIIASS